MYLEYNLDRHGLTPALEAGPAKIDCLGEIEKEMFTAAEERQKRRRSKKEQNGSCR